MKALTLNPQFTTTVPCTHNLDLDEKPSISDDFFIKIGRRCFYFMWRASVNSFICYHTKDGGLVHFERLKLKSQYKECKP